MLQRLTPRSGLAAAILTVPVAMGLTACGSSGKSSGSGSSSSSSPTKLTMSIAEQGQKASFTVPKSVTGGLVELSLKNGGKGPHSAQLIRRIGNHTAQEALKVVASQSGTIPAWIRAEGGVGSVDPGSTGTATLTLPPGQYTVADTSQQGGGPPAYADFTVKKGASGSLPKTSVTVDGASTGKNAYTWKVSGQLKAGQSQVTFASGGQNTLHFIGAFRITGKHSQAEVLKALSGQGKPPSWVDQKSFYDTAALDGGKSQVTPLKLAKAGTYVLFCPLRDRNGGKPHFLEGMLKTVSVK